MNSTDTIPKAPVPKARTPGRDDPPVDFSREEATYERERARLVRDHLGKIALIHGDDVVGAFSTVGEVIRTGHERFGDDQIMIKEIRDPDLPVFMPLADARHPSFQPD